MSEIISVDNMFYTGLNLESSCIELVILSYFGLVDAKIRASDKDLPVRQKYFVGFFGGNNDTKKSF